MNAYSRIVSAAFVASFFLNANAVRAETGTEEVAAEVSECSTAEAVYFRGRNLADVVAIGGHIYGKFGGAQAVERTVSSSSAGTSPAGVFYFVNDGETLTAQFQVKSYTSYGGVFHCVKLQLRQVGDDIYGKALYIRSGTCTYGNNNLGEGWSLGDDWDTNSYTGNAYTTQLTDITATFMTYSGTRTVTFLDKDSNQITTVSVAAGSDVDPEDVPTPPTVPGYVFYMWDGSWTHVTEDRTITAVYHQLFTVTFLDADGTVISSQTVEETTSATEPDMTGHTYGGNPFSGWDTDVSDVRSNLTVTAVYAPVPADVVAAIDAGNLPSGALVWGGGASGTWDDSTANWYNLNKVTRLWSAGAVAVFPCAAAISVSGSKQAGGFVLAANGDVALSGDAISLPVGAETVFNSDGSLVFSNNVSCADGMVQRLREAHDVFVPGTTYDDEIEGNLTSESHLLFSNVSLADVEYIEGTMTGNFGSAHKTLTLSTASAATSDGGAFYFSNDGTALTAQFQIKSYSTGRNCIKVRLEQVGDDIYGQIDYEKSGWTSGGNPPPAIGANWDDYSGNGYSQSICDLKVGVPDKTIYDALPTDVRVEVAGNFAFTGTLVVSNGVFAVTDDGTLSGGNSTGSIVTWNDGTILFSSSANQTLVSDIQNKGTGEVRLLHGSTLALKEPSSDRSWRFAIAGDASATGYKALPADSGSITVLPGGSLALDSFNSYWGPKGGASIIVQTNGLLRLLNKNSIGVSKAIRLEGGTLTNEVNQANILYKLYMNDGAKVSGTGFRVGFKDYYNSWSFINVDGSLPSLIDAESLMVGFQYPAGTNAPIGVKFIVADVTGDDASDLVVASPITEREGVTLFNEGYRDNLGVWKQGPGTLELAATNNACSTGVFKMEAGTVRLASTVGGGFGAFTLLGNATLDVASGAQVSFDDSSAQVWTSEATLNITGEPGTKSLRFGTDATGLTAAQLAQITFRGKANKVSLDAEGYLQVPGSSMMVLLR